MRRLAISTAVAAALLFSPLSGKVASNSAQASHLGPASPPVRQSSFLDSRPSVLVPQSSFLDSRTSILVPQSLFLDRRTSVAPGSAGETIFRAIGDEMDRAMRGLRLEGEPAPYYISCALDDVTTSIVRASLGSLVENSSARVRLLRVDVRVGDYAFDNSGFISTDATSGVMPGWATTSGMIASLDDDYDALRRQIWLMADASYKQAVNTYARKRAVYGNRAATDAVPDFARRAPSEAIVGQQAATVGGLDRWREAVVRLSAVFRERDAISASKAVLTIRRGARYFLDSEGTRALTPIASAVLVVPAETQAEDGMRLRDVVSVVENSPGDLPLVADLEQQVRDMAARLAARRAAPVADDYTGPVLLEGQASGEVAAQSLVPLFLSLRPMESDVPRGDVLAAAPTPFLTRIGSRVLPVAFSASDTPSLARYDSRAVAGAYVADSEGVRAEDVELVKDGKLLALLSSRRPQKGVLQSNGHGRGGGAQAGVFQLQSREAIHTSELKARYLERLREEGRPFGYIVRGVAAEVATRLEDAEADEMAVLNALLHSGGSRPSPRVTEIVRVWPDGTERPVRGLTFAEVPRTAFKELLGASRERRLHNARAMPSGAGGPAAFFSGGEEVNFSVIVPDLLFEELELQKVREIPQKSPIVPPPPGRKGLR